VKQEEEVMNEILTGQPAHQEEGDENEEGHVKESMLSINPRFKKLITSLRTAVEIGEGVLDKEATSHDDLLDSCIGL
jgi:hypothetical protein